MPIVLTGSYAAADQPGVRAWAFDPASGALTLCGEHRGIADPSFLTPHPSGRWVYAVSETGVVSHGAAGQVLALALDRAAGQVVFRILNAQPSGGDWPCHLGLDAAGRWLAVANYGSGSVSLFPVQADGALGAPTAVVQHSGHGPRLDRQEGPHAHAAVFSPDGEYLIVTDLGLDALMVYRLAAGRLELADRVPAAPGAGPRHLAFHPDGRALYVVNELNNSLTAYDYAAGELRERATVGTLPAAAPENLAADLHLSPAGDRIYLSNRGHNSLAIFTAAPNRLALADCGGHWPRNFALTPDGRHVLVANQHSGEVAVLPVRGDAVGAPVARVAVPEAACVVVLPEAA